MLRKIYKNYSSKSISNKDHCKSFRTFEHAELEIYNLTYDKVHLIINRKLLLKSVKQQFSNYP